LSAEKEFDKVPSKITAFRFGDGFLRFKKDKKGTMHLHAKNVEGNVRLHMFFNDDEHGAVLTNEQMRGTPEEHTTFETEKFLETLAKPVNEILQSIEKIDDNRFRGKKVQLSTIPKIRFVCIRKRTAYFEFDVETKECRFEDIDLYLPQIGVVKGWFGRELALIFVIKGEIHSLSVKAINRASKRLENQVAEFHLPSSAPATSLFKLSKETRPTKKKIAK